MVLNSFFSSIRGRSSRRESRRPLSTVPTFWIDEAPDAPPSPPRSSFAIPSPAPSTSNMPDTPCIPSQVRVPPKPIASQHATQHAGRSPSNLQATALLHEAMASLGLNKSSSLREILLPPVPQFGPIQISNLTASGNSSIRIGPPTLESRYPEKGSRHAKEKSMGFSFALKRKPVPSASGPIITEPEQMRFDPRAFLSVPNKHLRVKQALKARYRSKFRPNFQPADGVDPHEYDFLWATSSELERKAVADILWARERYAQARRGEPSDEDLLQFYDLENYDVGMSDQRGRAAGGSPMRQEQLLKNQDEGQTFEEALRMAPKE